MWVWGKLHCVAALYVHITPPIQQMLCILLLPCRLKYIQLSDLQRSIDPLHSCILTIYHHHQVDFNHDKHWPCGTMAAQFTQHHTIVTFALQTR